MNNARLRKIPSTHRVLEAVADRPWAGLVPRRQLVDAIRTATDLLRRSAAAPPRGGAPADLSLDAVVEQVRAVLARQLVPRLRPVMNATGIILHTNLGRAPLADQALEAVQRVSDHYCNLEMDLDNGERTDRYRHVEEHLTRLTGAEAALVVNNDAGAVLLILDTFAKGKDVVVSRGELIEIGGSFRLPEIMLRSGARLVEVGTTNRTYLRDYEGAITPETALLFKAHTSNYRLTGFTAAPSSGELAALGKRLEIPTVEDLGNGLLVDLVPLGLPREPLVQDQLAAGIDLVAWSGDKLLGGPQAGVIVGRRDLMDQLKRNPLTRALRVDKLHIAALEATLRYYLEDRWRDLPLYRMLALPAALLKRRAIRLARGLEAALGDDAAVEVREGTSEVGGGTLPGISLPTWLVAVNPRHHSPDRLAERLRLGSPPLVARILKERLVLDPRTLRKADLPRIPALLALACAPA